MFELIYTPKCFIDITTHQNPTMPRFTCSSAIFTFRLLTIKYTNEMCVQSGTDQTDQPSKSQNQDRYNVITDKKHSGFLIGISIFR